MDWIPEGLEVAERLGVSVEQGWTEEAATERRARFGANRLPEVKPESILSMFLGALADKTLIILMGAAALSIAASFFEPRFGGHGPRYLEGIAILGAVLIASLVNTANEARARKQFRLLSRERADVSVKALRGGAMRALPIQEIVVGDVLFFDAGDRISADGVLLRGVDVQLDESMLTGESHPVDKGPSELEVKSGTTVVQGNGAMLVTAVGEATEVGKLHLSLSEVSEELTPLQERLSRLADRVGLFGLGAAVLTFAALAASALAHGRMTLALDMALVRQLLDFSIVAVTIVVVAVPEGLPLAVTVSLAYSVRRMARDKNLVRRLKSCETMGAATVICSDKTGTLTRNRMSVVGGWAAGHAFDRLPSAAALGPSAVRMIAEIAAINATAFLEEAGGVERCVGNPTEGALLALSAALGEDWKALRAGAKVVRLLGFTSERKRMSTIVASGAGARLLTKGAPEMLLERATAILDGRAGEDAAPRPLTADDRRMLEAELERISRAGQRSLALAIRELSEAAARAESADALERDLVLVALFGIDDPIRPEVTQAVAACRNAGVDVKIVTGDNPATAEAIARQIGLMGEGDLVLDGRDFRVRDEAALTAVLPRLRVLARSIPSDKLRLVNLLRARGEVVAVTGDGTNDAPALKAADVGFAMGLTGTEVAKEASDIIILDDNFASIVRAILWGRAIFANIRKFLQFQLTVNVVALTTAFTAAVLDFGVPLNAVQLLWVNLIMDTLAALALATEPPSEKLLQQRPHGRHAPLITRSMWFNISLLGGYMVAVLVALMSTDFLVPAGTTSGQRLTLIFNTFVMMQLFNEVNARSTRFDRGALTGLLRSRLFLLVVGATSVVQVLIVEFGGSLFKTEPLGPRLWLVSVLLGASTLLVGLVIRRVGRRALVRQRARRTFR